MTWLDLTIILIAIFALFRGYRTGLVIQLTGLIVIIICFFYISDIANLIFPYIANYFSFSFTVIMFIAYILAFIGILIAMSIVAYILNLIFRLPILSIVNTVGGIVLAFFKWMLITSLLLFLCVKLDFANKVLTPQLMQKSVIAQKLLIIPDVILTKLLEEVKEPMEKEYERLTKST